MEVYVFIWGGGGMRGCVFTLASFNFWHSTLIVKLEVIIYMINNYIQSRQMLMRSDCQNCMWGWNHQNKITYFTIANYVSQIYKVVFEKKKAWWQSNNCILITNYQWPNEINSRERERKKNFGLRRRPTWIKCPFDPPPIQCPQDKGMEVKIYSPLLRVDTLISKENIKNPFLIPTDFFPPTIWHLCRVSFLRI